MWNVHRNISQSLPECDEMRNIFNKTVTAYLTYLGTVLPDIAQQTRVSKENNISSAQHFYDFIPTGSS